MSKKPSVAIILINWNGYDYTKACIGSLKNIIYDNYSVIIVDNASSDQSLSKLKREFQDLIFIESDRNLGFAGGNNLAMEYSLKNGFEYILLLNNDTIVEPDFLNPMVDFLESNEKYIAAQPKILHEKEREVIWNAGGGGYPKLNISWSIGGGEVDKGQYDHQKDVFWITGCCILVRTNFLSQVGLLDDSYFAYYEDVDWSMRMIKKGWKLRYIPQSVIYHVVSASSKKAKKKEGVIAPIVHYYRIRNHLFLLRDHGRGFQFILSLFYQTVKMCLFVLVLGLRGRFLKVKAVLKGYYDGITVKR